MGFHRTPSLFSSVAKIPDACESCKKRRPCMLTQSTSAVPPATRREIFAWAMFDFANSGYTTVVLTAIFNAYFVGVVAGDGPDRDGTATLLWALANGIANLLVLLSAPVVGAIADPRGEKKGFLLGSTAGW